MQEAKVIPLLKPFPHHTALKVNGTSSEVIDQISMGFPTSNDPKPSESSNKIDPLSFERSAKASLSCPHFDTQPDVSVCVVFTSDSKQFARTTVSGSEMASEGSGEGEREGERKKEKERGGEGEREKEREGDKHMQAKNDLVEHKRVSDDSLKKLKTIGEPSHNLRRGRSHTLQSLPDGSMTSQESTSDAPHWKESGESGGIEFEEVSLRDC